jgi:hypothetical protein
VTDGPKKILFILGTTRCGSTIVENILGSVDGFFSAGEIHMLARALMAHGTCGCGREIVDCPVWGKVLQDVSVGEADAATIWGWQSHETRILHTPRLTRTTSWPRTGRPRLDRYVAFLQSLYPTLAERTGARVIVDSSKSPAALEIVRNLEGLDLYVLHVVRDPRGVAYSWHRGRPSDGRTAGGYQPGPLRVSGRWIATNVLGARVTRRLPPSRSMTLRYESFAAAPEATIERIVRFVGEPEATLPFIDATTADLTPNHAVSGNRSRFAGGRVAITLDDEWRTHEPTLRTAVSAVTLPWLGRYGYRLRS